MERKKVLKKDFQAKDKISEINSYKINDNEKLIRMLIQKRFYAI